MRRKGNTFALSVGMQTGAATVESSMEIPQKIKSGSALRPRDPTSGNISKETQNTNLEEHKHPYPSVHCSIIYNHQDTETAQVDKTTMRHLHNGFYSAIKKEENFTPCDSMYGLRGYYA